MFCIMTRITPIENTLVVMSPGDTREFDFSKVSSYSFPVTMFKNLIVTQSLPDLLVPYANMLPSWLQDCLVRLTVPSAEKVLGSSRTLGSACKESCTYTTDWFCRPEFLEK